MIGIAPSEKDTSSAALEKRLGDDAGIRSLCFATHRAWQLAPVAALLLLGCGCHSTAPQATPATMSQDLKPKVVRGVLPLAIQPDQAKWRRLQAGMTEGEVTALLGSPYLKDARPPADAQPNVRHLYSWYYGDISFRSFTTQGSYYCKVTFHEGRVEEIRDPWDGKFSTNVIPTVPELVLPHAGQTLDHYPRFMDFRWKPASGIYPIEYEVTIQVLEVDQQDAEHFEDYIRKTIDRNRADWKEAGTSEKEMDKTAAWLARDLRQRQGAQATYSFRTHDIYLPFTWVGANTGRWRIRATNQKGASDWSAWRYFNFST